MKKIKSSLLALSGTLMVCQVVFAQSAEEKAAFGACGALFGGLTFTIIAVIALNIALLVWVARDAKARGISGIGWMVLVFFVSGLGLIIYLFARPRGEVEECPRCNNKRLKAMAKCPHCGN